MPEVRTSEHFVSHAIFAKYCKANSLIDCMPTQCKNLRKLSTCLVYEACERNPDTSKKYLIEN